MAWDEQAVNGGGGGRKLARGEGWWAASDLARRPQLPPPTIVEQVSWRVMPVLIREPADGLGNAPPTACLYRMRVGESGLAAASSALVAPRSTQAASL